MSMGHDVPVFFDTKGSIKKWPLYHPKGYCPLSRGPKHKQSTKSVYNSSSGWVEVNKCTYWY